ncbi:MAG: hypothetical protein J5604_05465 [Bacteroidales bacterium]|nr:hypothetical protein [Bacteroidales bacterium]
MEEKLNEIANKLTELSEKVDLILSRLEALEEKSFPAAPHLAQLSDDSAEQDLVEFPIDEEEFEKEEEEGPEEDEVEDEPVEEEVDGEEPAMEESGDEEVGEPEEEKKRDWYDWEYDYPAEYVEDLVGSMGINDRLEFIRELFNSNSVEFERDMQHIDQLENFKTIVSYMRQTHPNWDEESDTVYRFYMHVRRKFRK